MKNQAAQYGFTRIAERWNGRLAMLGFTIGIITELLTGKSILSQLGIM
ncbi:high light inducible protein [Leptolyngbyaceae cyanobacterium CCMR0082]|uniref:High light inducible protein n=1 Tax=Adonisia turfae CCMR0082 TaxID=2304604 RepID=A0A6M0S429_9CYAN|nr:chlorophyll a/b-binding protein [Adonisia turfae]NEZ63126.1 high light inducible protein [Adonisia turfae CCMR0082]